MKKALALIMILAFMAGCKTKTGKVAEPTMPDPAYSSYVTAFTSGIISNTENIIVEFSSNIAAEVQEKTLEKPVLEIKPDIKGSFIWLDNRTLSLIPDESLKPGTTYQCELQLNKITNVPDALKTMIFQFQTKQQSIVVDWKGLNSLDDENLQWQQLKGVLRCSDYASETGIMQTFRASQNGKDLRITWSHNSSGTEHEFTIDSISRKKEKEEILVQWNGKAIQSTDEGEKNVSIPPLGDFKLMNISTTQQPRQVIHLYFSDPIKKTQDLRGLVYLESGDDVKLERKGSLVKVYPAKRMQGTFILHIDDGLRNSLDYNLVESYKKDITFRNINPDVKLLGDGVILPGTDGWIFPFKAVNLKAVNVTVIQIFEDNIGRFFQENQYHGNNSLKRVGRMIIKKEVPLSSDKPIDLGTWNMFSLDLADLIEAEPGAIYRISINFERQQALLPCITEELNDTEEAFREDRDMERFNNPPTGSWYGNWKSYNYREREDPCTASYYNYRFNQDNTSRNVLASDMGIIAKAGSSTDLFVAVSSLQSTDVMAGVEIEILNYQLQVIATARTGGDGTVNIPLEERPYLLIAKQGRQGGYLRLDDGSALSTSMFNVGGSKNKDGLKGYLYGERGVWRPGDSIYMCFILEDEKQILPENHPVRFELFTPENQLYLSTVRSDAVNGVYDFRTATEGEAPTGNWLAKVHVGGSAFTKTIRIETVKPNRLKIQLDFEEEILHGTDIRTNLEVKWLHGAKARGLKADMEMDLRAGQTTFKEYPGYIFDDPVKEMRADAEKVYSGQLDSLGKANFNIEINVGKEAPGMLQAFFKTRVFEKSGDFSIDRFPVRYSPYTKYVGVKIPEGGGWNGALYSDEDNMIPIVTVDQFGKPVNIKNLRIEIYDIRWRWWWDRDNSDNLASYVRNKSRNLIKRDVISTVNGKAMYQMNFGKKLWGRKLLRITDPGGHSVGCTFYLDYRGYWETQSQEGPGGAEMLQFTSDKKSYTVGEDMEVTLPEIDEGRALISVENGSRILETFWVEAPITEAIKIKATAAMAPNAYIHISLIQPHQHTANDKPIRLYGIQSVEVKDEQTILYPELNMPDVLEPESEVVFEVGEAGGRAMTYTLAVVDDGLLDLTRFTTPEPWNYFYAREALGIRTWDMYKYVLGALKGEMAGLLAIGGDEFAKQNDKKNSNRFKPVVKFLGPFELAAGKTAKHRITMPNYVGSVRTMVVASSKGAYGSVEKTTPVKKPLMVLATLPRMVSPSEKLTLPVTVFSMNTDIRDVEVEVSCNAQFSVVGETKQKIRFKEEGDQLVNFELQVADRTGQGKVLVRVHSGSYEASYEVDLKVRMPNPRISATETQVLEAGKNWKSSYEAIGVAGTNTGVLEISSIPPMQLEHRMKYLINYPHGCVEQTTSAVFPQLYLHRFMELDAGQQRKIQDQVMAGIKRLKSFQVSNGGLTYWPGSATSVSEWGSSYAGHFMLEAEKLGYQMPAGFIRNWARYQTRMANSWDRESGQSYYRRSNEINQAYRLYTLALAKKPALGAMNRMREMKELSIGSKWMLAGAYILTGKEEVARNLVARLSTSVKQYRELSYTYGSHTRDQALILEVLTLMGDKATAKKLVDDLASRLASNEWMSTQTTAFTLLSIGKFMSSNGIEQGLSAAYKLNGTSAKVKSSAPVKRVELSYDGTVGGNIELSNTSTGTLWVTLHREGIPLDPKVPDESSDLLMEVRYLDMEGRELNPSKLEQGTDFLAELKLSHPGIRSDYKELALSQLFPSGWEIRNFRLDEMDDAFSRDKPDYQDIRDDRVYSYFSLNKGQSRTFTLMLNAAYLGEYMLPAVYCEAMYDREIHATRSGKWIKVVPQK